MSSSIDIIVRALFNAETRYEFIEGRFPNQVSYCEEWHRRTSEAFWAHMDSSTQRAFTDYALQKHHLTS